MGLLQLLSGVSAELVQVQVVARAGACMNDCHSDEGMGFDHEVRWISNAAI